MSNRLLALLVVALSFAVAWRMTHRTPPPVVELETAAVPPKAKKVDYVAISQAPRPPVKKTAELSPECQAFWDGLNQLNLRELAGFPPKVAVPTGTACKATPAEFNKLSADYQKLCGDLPALKEKAANGAISKKDWLAKSNQCYGVIIAYRAQITDYETRDIPLSQITDPGVLTDKMMAEFSTNPGAAADAADRLLQVDDKNFSAAKTSAMARFSDALQNGAPNPDDPKWASWEKSVDRAREMSDNIDEKLDLDEMAAVGRAKATDLAGADQIGDDLISEHPDRGLGNYIKSAVDWKQGDKETALQFLDKAIAIEKTRGGNTPTPDYMRFVDTRKRLVNDMQGQTQNPANLPPGAGGPPPVYMYSFSGRNQMASESR